MAAKARSHGVAFRPHFKTHQSRVIGRWFRDEGVSSITVSSLKMASYFAADGWNDITVAFPVNVLEIERVRSLSSAISLNLLIEDPLTIPILERQLERPVGVFVKIDAGYHRTGIPADRIAEIDALIAILSSSQNLRFRGFIAHAGNTYRAKTREEILTIHESTCRSVAGLKAHYRHAFPDMLTSVGDTPACSVAEQFYAIDEIRPGNFVFYDAMQLHLGSCSADQIAVAMACPIVATHPDRNQAILYGGAIHFSKDFIINGGNQSFGELAELHDHGWSAPLPGAYLSSLSQEHGVVTASPEFTGRLKSGSVVGVLPVHSCLTADCMKGYVTLEGDRIDHMSRTM